MKHIRDPVTGRCAVCESNGVHSSVLHNGIVYPNHSPRPARPPKPQVIEVREEPYHPSPRPQYYSPSQDKPYSEVDSTPSMASASQVTFATQTSFHEDLSPATTPTPPRRERRHRQDSPRYSPEGSPNRARYGDSKFKEPQIWFVGEGPGRSRRSPSPIRRERRRSPSLDRKMKSTPRERTPSPDNRRRERNDNERGHRSSYRNQNHRNQNQRTKDIGYETYGKTKSNRSGSRRCCRGCRSWCTCRRCCMVFWVVLLLLLALGLLAAAIYFAVAGAENANAVQDITRIKDPRYLIYGVDQPCRTTVVTSPTTTTELATLDPNETTTDSTTTEATSPTTTLILCYDTTTTIVREGSRYRDSGIALGCSLFLQLSLPLFVVLIMNFGKQLPL